MTARLNRVRRLEEVRDRAARVRELWERSPNNGENRSEREPWKGAQ